MLRRAVRIAHWSLVVALTGAALATAGLAIRSYTRVIVWDSVHPQSITDADLPVSFVQINDGRFWFNRWTIPAETNRIVHFSFWRFSFLTSPLKYGEVLDWRSAFGYGLKGPIWPVAIGLAAYPVVTMLVMVPPRLRRRSRRRRGLCTRCAYDLRGSPSGTCPECGTQI